MLSFDNNKQQIEVEFELVAARDGTVSLEVTNSESVGRDCQSTADIESAIGQTLEKELKPEAKRKPGKPGQAIAKSRNKSSGTLSL